MEDVSLTVAAGEFVAVQGPSGCGKTTLLLLAGVLLKPEGGEVLLQAQNLYQLSSGQRARFRAANIGFVFQQFHLVPYLSVLDNILLPTLAMAPDGDAQARALALAGQFRLTDRLHHVPAALSTGERQRTALARALLNRPKLLLADEPTGNLDRDNAVVVLDALAGFARAGGAVLLVTHDVNAAGLASRALHIRQGRMD